jgi:hypothetical protein
MKPLGPHRLCQFPNHIAVRPHLRRRPVTQTAVVHCKPVMMFRDRHYIFGSRLLKEPCPRPRVKPFRPEHRNKILVPKLVHRPIRGDVVLVFVRFLSIHISWIPLISKSGNRIDSPMYENPKLRVLIPLRHFVSRKRFPIRTERPLPTLAIHFFEDCRSCLIVFRAGALPSLIDNHWLFGGRSGARTRRTPSLRVHGPGNNRQNPAE